MLSVGKLLCNGGFSRQGEAGSGETRTAFYVSCASVARSFSESFWDLQSAIVVSVPGEPLCMSIGFVQGATLITLSQESADCVKCDTMTIEWMAEVESL
jgi:hypothetical protein